MTVLRKYENSNQILTDLAIIKIALKSNDLKASELVREPYILVTRDRPKIQSTIRRIAPNYRRRLVGHVVIRKRVLQIIV